ncbi:MAG TPA: ABC transporter substrate-binding protein [Methylomirabilota bacterium]
MRSVRHALVIISFLALGLAATAEAGAGRPGEQLRGRLDRVVGILEDGALKSRPDARRAALRDAASEIFDFTEITRRSLGRHWRTATPAEREELTQLLATLLERAYMGRIEQYSGERIVMAGETVDGDLATVRTRLQRKGGIDMPVDYRLYRAGDRWLAYDVAVEGVSLIANYRAQFNRILQRSSAQALVKRLRATLE